MNNSSEDQNSKAPNYEQIQGQGFEEPTSPEDVVQVVYQSDQHGLMVGIESSLLQSKNNVQQQQQQDSDEITALQFETDSHGGSQQQALSRAASTLPSVAEESTTSGSGQINQANVVGHERGQSCSNDQSLIENNERKSCFVDNENQIEPGSGIVDAKCTQNQTIYPTDQAVPLYSTVSKQQQAVFEQPENCNSNLDQSLDEANCTSFYSNVSYQQQQQQQQQRQPEELDNLETNEQDDEAAKINQEINEIIARQKGVEKGSFRHNFRKKLGLSASTNETELGTLRQRLLDDSSAATNLTSSSLATKSLLDESKSADAQHTRADEQNNGDDENFAPSKFKRTHSVSFNIHSARSNRLSVDIRYLPSYLTHKRASIVDVARGAMSSLMHSLSGGSATGSVASERRDSAHSAWSTNGDDDDNEPIFEEPIAPTLSLGQRVALVRSGGSEFGTVGWIGQLAEVDDDWMVGVIFDNMIGNCDGAYNGIRYFYARENYAMFVPLSSLTKTDNYIGRPETGTMLSRMSVALKPGQLISIQRSSIRLQHCFLNAPHQRVGHDVRAVSNRLHCQCHNCGPCAHLTKQGRITAVPHFGSHHLPHRKKNSLAHAAVELLAHHHHHFHEEEEAPEEKDYQFGDNAAHACNFVRYSCCQQNGAAGHEFSSDCGMVRPELLDNLIHAPKAPHRRSRQRRARRADRKQARNMLVDQQQQQQLQQHHWPGTQMGAIEMTSGEQTGMDTMSSMARTVNDGYSPASGGSSRVARSSLSSSSSSSSSRSRSSSYSSGSMSRSCSSDKAISPARHEQYNYYTQDSSTIYRPQSSSMTGGVYNTIDSHISIMDQRRFICQRDSNAFIHHAPSYDARWNEGHFIDDSELGEPNNDGNHLGKRILRCFGCLKRSLAGPRNQRGRRNFSTNRRASGRSSASSSASKRKLSARDKVLEYRRRQSTFVPSTLAKPQEDFASHGIILAKHGDDRPPNSDYSSCSRSSSCSSSPRSQPQPPPPPPQDVPHQQQQRQPLAWMTQEQDVHADPHQAVQQHVQVEGTCQDCGLKCSASDNARDASNIINYGDYSFGDYVCDLYKKHETSQDSALVDLAYVPDTFKTDSSSDTLKQLVDRSINEIIPQPIGVDHSTETAQFGSPPLISDHSSECQYCEQASGEQQNDLLEISSPTASTASAMGTSNMDESEISRAIECLNLTDDRREDKSDV